MRITAIVTSIFLLAAYGGLRLFRLNPQDANAANQEEYEFVQDTGRLVELIQGETESIGKLDASGNFVPDKRWFQLKKGQPLVSGPATTLINGLAQKGVYEFRSGRLIPGDIDDKGNFIPTVGGRIIDFKDYRYGPKAPKIYNLPGKFVKKEKKDGKK
jgi:hypothetical protein